VTLGFGEIVRIFLNNLSQPVNITRGPQGLAGIDPVRMGGIDFSRSDSVLGVVLSGPIKYYYLLLVLLLAFAMGASFGGVAGGMFAAIQGFISPESFVLVESVMVVSMVVLGGMG